MHSFVPTTAGQFLEALLVAAHCVAVEMHAELEDDEMSTLQVLGLRLIARESPAMTAIALAGALGCTRTTASQLVQRLARDGYVKQQPAEDRRCKLLVPTEAGLRAGELALDAVERCAASATQSFTVQERAVLVTLLERLGRDARCHRRERSSIARSLPPAATRGRGRGRPHVHVR